MNLIFTEEQLPEESFAGQMHQAATLAVTGEGLNPAICSASVTFVTPEEIRELNRDYRNKDAVTDVLSFPMFASLDEAKTDCEAYGEEEGYELALGDVVINKQRAEEQAKEFGHSVEREIVYLMVHSLFHLMGYDHEIEEDKAVMRAKEEAVMNALGITRRKAAGKEKIYDRS